MKKFIGGALAVIIGLPGLALFFSDFYLLLAGGVPILLILGGGLAFYLGYEDIKADDVEPSMVQPETAVSSEEDVSEGVVHLEKETVISPSSQTDDESAHGTANGPAQFMGNTETLVFHSIACNFSKGKKCTQGFISKDEALNQGYKPCKVCAP